MTSKEVEARKKRADQLVDSYGAFRLSSRMEEAVQHLAAIWQLNSIDLQILRPGKSVSLSNAVVKTSSFLSGSGKVATGGVVATHTKEVMKLAGGVAEKAAAASGKVNAAKAVAIAAAKAGAQVVKKNPVTALVTGGAVVASGFGVGSSLKRELRRFNDNCYKQALDRVSDGQV